MLTVDTVSRPYSYSMHSHTHSVCVRLQALKSDKRPDGEWYYFIHYPVSPHSKHDRRRALLCCLGPSNCFVSVSSGAACATVQEAPDFRAVLSTASAAQLGCAQQTPAAGVGQAI